MVIDILICLAAGLILGILSGMLGIGGGVMMVPVFRLGFGLSAVATTATSLFAIIPSALSGTIFHVRSKTCIPKLGLALGLGGALTAPVGVLLAQKSPSWLIMSVAAVIIGYSAIIMVKKAIAMPRAKTIEKDIVSKKDSEVVKGENSSSAQPKGRRKVETPPVPSIDTKDYLIGIGIGVIAGVASGYVGVGGGFIMVPLMLSFIHLPMKYASGTSLIAVLLIAIPGSVEQIYWGNVDYMIGCMVALGAIPGAYVGARLVEYIPERTLRFIFGGILLISSFFLMANELGFFG